VFLTVQPASQPNVPHGQRRKESFLSLVVHVPFVSSPNVRLLSASSASDLIRSSSTPPFPDVFRLMALIHSISYPHRPTPSASHEAEEARGPGERPWLREEHTIGQALTSLDNSATTCSDAEI
jgi:hypothetical protein